MMNDLVLSGSRLTRAVHLAAGRSHHRAGSL